MLIDEIQIKLKAGNGGNGHASFGRTLKSGPMGGNGGKGGDVYIQTTTDLNVLLQYSNKTLLSAEDGEKGAGNRQAGGTGKDLIVYVPVGAVITDSENEESIELINPGEVLKICEGGFGGRGNAALATPDFTTPKVYEKGERGQERDLKIELKLIADIGIIGLPNSGKSTLISEVTAARPKIADYPFTTLEPTLGVVDQKIMVDLPALMEGSFEGKGLGNKFLKHLKRVNLILHTISSESENVTEDYEIIRKELEESDPNLLDKKEIIVLTKSDLISESELKEKVKILKKIKKEVLTISILDEKSLLDLKNKVT